MKKALIFIPTILLVAVGVSTHALTSSSFAETILRSNPSQIVSGTITIGEGENATIVDGENTFKSSNHNDFTFYCNGITKTNGYYSFSGGYPHIRNIDILNGIYEIDIYGVDGTGDAFVQYGYDNAYEFKGELIKVDEGACAYNFDLVKPNFFELTNNENSGAEPVLFTKIVICYSCTEAERIKSFYSLKQTIDGFRLSEGEVVAVEAGTNIADIPLSSLCADYGIYLNDAQVSDVVIKYMDDLLEDSTTVVEGRNNATLTFNYNGYKYICENPITIIGYDHTSIYNQSAYSSVSQFRIQETNAIPEEFKMEVNKSIKFYNSSDNTIFDCYLNKSEIEITNEMIVSMDDDAFTAMGKHMMNVTYGGDTYTLHYTVYDPEYNNIRDIYFNGSLAYPMGTSISDFITDMLSKNNSVIYYEDDPELPTSVTLTAGNFDVYDGMFDNPGYIDVGIHYQNYVGYVTVHITAVRGNFVKTYSNEDGLFVMGQTLHYVHLYDNGICEFEEKGDEYNELFSYTLVDNVLSVYIEGNIFKFNVEDVNDTFTTYVKQGNIIYSLKVNFRELGAPDEYIYDGIMYDDSTIVFDIMGMVIECAYEVDPNDSNIIYFDFAVGMLYHCKGTIDTTLMQMLVEEV